MENKTTLAQGLDLTDGKTRVDAACKRILSEKAILARIMKECVREYKDCPVRDIEEKYIEGEPQISNMPVLADDARPVIEGMDTVDKSVREGTVVYDIRFRAKLPGEEERIGLIVNVEAQGRYDPGYPLVSRGVYYCSRMLSAQYGREFTGSQYGKLQKVYSIWICMNPPKKNENTITEYAMKRRAIMGEAEEAERNYDLLSVIMVCLGRPEGENYTGLVRMLDVMFSDRMELTERKEILQNEYGYEMTREMEEEVSTMCNWSEGLIERGMQRGLQKGMELGIQRGREQGILQGREQGIQQGREQGILQGREQGIRQGVDSALEHSIKNLMESLGLPIEKAMELLKIPQEDRPRYRELLEEK